MRRHDYSPLSSEEPNSRNIFNYDPSPPPLLSDPHLSHSERMAYFSSTSSSPLVPTSVILPDEPSRPSYNFETPVGLEPPSTIIPPLTLVPRRFGPVPSMPNHHLNHHLSPHPHHPSQFLQPLQPSSTHPSHHLRDLMDRTDFPSSSTTATEAELKTLQRRVRELEGELDERSKLRDMLGVIPPDWEERTSFREQKYCSLNRAGNALCAWHDSRRERRQYAPRMAPHRTLNCGCTYEEAIFEESLSRNGVGSFWPGESVRMDPMLRNKLLELLQNTDGDFERNPDGTWKEGQSSTAWEERARHPVRRERS